jgi:exodeoxyribonuclease V|tara:strand:+ start:333 stop:1736 length:1404 start_codon:yes stop_codon:yes gene_type:complete
VSLYSIFSSKFTPTADQKEALYLLEEFALSPTQNIFILKGFAGTGKTTIVDSLVQFLTKNEREYYLLAPTGKAAKVIQKYTRKFASTIHRKIYQAHNIGSYQNFKLFENKSQGGVFIVDEASMISSEEPGFMGNPLIEDFLEYVFMGQDCKIIFIGDVAQLPPVNELFSAALDPNFMGDLIGQRIKHIQLTQVIRQAQDSGILFNATLIRSNIESNIGQFPDFNFDSFNDIKVITGQEVHEKLEEAYQEFGVEETVVLTRSNKTANLYNNQIRNRVFQHDEPITGGELLMVVKNNYYWTKDYDGIGFIANGDTIEINRIQNEEGIYNQEFLNVQCSLKDHYNNPEIDLKLIKAALNGVTASMSKQEMDAFILTIKEDIPEESSRRKIWEYIKSTPHFNAIQVKYAYAITGHKAQGGQWDCVFIDQSFFKKEWLTVDYLRWLYTCFTRAKKKLYLVNFKFDFNKKPEF